MPPTKLVIDACVGHASDSKVCRDVLNTVYTHKYHVVMSEQLWDEWKRHKGRFAVSWMKAMADKGRLLRKAIETNDDIRNKIRSSIAAKKDPTILVVIMKDMHLVEAALVTDNIIISLDERARGHFKRASTMSEELKVIIWVNPHEPVEKAIDWLKYGARPEDFRMLGYVAPDSDKFRSGHRTRQYAKQLYKSREKAK
ncbi:conserved hypothetical protein [Methanocella paludicola SANAE]|uniref:PIN domain-containing protein n=1 Tax=Methanocella paludicola (strain DSM 17711 / JCM 13418 / NBRC 101707 / SANAE) TaxID=304371 RepID=D1Z0R2_METPS|nr:hypothetical protein [Methanocella paludicola]BAI62284.1 conserved hypothetical protein [Methanocella paludicola SANAE]